MNTTRGTTMGQLQTMQQIIPDRHSKLVQYLSDEAHMAGRSDPAVADYMRGVEDVLSWLVGDAPTGRMRALVDEAFTEMRAMEGSE